MRNEITAYFKGTTGVAESVYQHDYGMIMNIDGLTLSNTFDVQFEKSGSSSTITAVGSNNRVAIPNDCLAVPGKLTAYIYTHTGSHDGETAYVVTFQVINRARPDDDITDASEENNAKAIVRLQTEHEADVFKINENLDAIENAATALTARVTTAEGDIDSLEAQFATVVSAVTTDTEVTNIRVGDDGVTYSTAGEAVRNQFSDVKSAFNANNTHSDTRFNIWDERWEIGSIDDSTGDSVSNNTVWRNVGFIPVEPNVDYYIKGVAARMFYYNESKTFISYEANVGNRVFTTPANCKYIRFRTGSVVNPQYNYDMCINVSQPNTDYSPYNGQYVSSQKPNYLIEQMIALYAGLDKKTIEQNLLKSEDYIENGYVGKNNDGSFTDLADGLSSVIAHTFGKGTYTISLIPLSGYSVNTLFIREDGGSNTFPHLTIRLDEEKQVVFKIRSRGTGAKFYIQIVKGIAQTEYQSGSFVDLKRILDIEENYLNLVDAGITLLTPQMFGAVGDGVTDDTVAFQAAFDCMENATVYIPSGTYAISNTLTIKRNVAIVGEKATKFRQGTTLLFSSNTKLFDFSTTSSSMRCVLENLNIVGESKSGSIGVYVSHYPVDATIGFKCENVSISYFDVAWQLEYNAFLSTLTDCKAMNCGTGFYIHSSTTTTLKKCLAAECNVGYDMEDNTYSSYINCACDACEYGYVGEKLYGVTFDACGCEFTNLSPMFTLTDSTVVLNGCRSHNCREENRDSDETVISKPTFAEFDNCQVSMAGCYEYNAERPSTKSVEITDGLLTLASCNLCNEPNGNGDVVGASFIKSLSLNKYYNTIN